MKKFVRKRRDIQSHVTIDKKRSEKSARTCEHASTSTTLNQLLECHTIHLMKTYAESLLYKLVPFHRKCSTENKRGKFTQKAVEKMRTR